MNVNEIRNAFVWLEYNGHEKEIENLLGEKVNLKLWVKVRRDWRQDPAFLKSIGYDKKEL